MLVFRNRQVPCNACCGHPTGPLTTTARLLPLFPETVPAAARNRTRYGPSEIYSNGERGVRIAGVEHADGADGAVEHSPRNLTTGIFFILHL